MENVYILYRVIKAKILGCLYYVFRIFPICRNQIVFSNFDGKQGYGDNLKAIAEQIIQKYGTEKYKLVWLVNDINKVFPDYIYIKKNTIINKAYYLTTSGIWIDNVRKGLEVRKRKKQLYIATWHGMIGFKKVGALRGAEFPKIAKMVSCHDSDMADVFLSNSKWSTNVIQQAFFFHNTIIKTGSPRCDVLFDRSDLKRRLLFEKYSLDIERKYIVYAPTFRGYNQNISMNQKSREISFNVDNVVNALEQRFGSQWTLLYRSHPETVSSFTLKESVKYRDISWIDDFYEVLACADMFISDYSSCVFDVAVMKIPVFLYVDDFHEYSDKRGLLWDLETLPFAFAKTEQELIHCFRDFKRDEYVQQLENFFKDVDLLEDGNASRRVVDIIDEWYRMNGSKQNV